MEEEKASIAFWGSMSKIEPTLFLGDGRSSWNRELLEENRITAIVSLTNAPLGFWGTRTREFVLANRHMFIPCVDSSTQNLLIHMSDICDFIDKMLLPRQPSEDLKESEVVLVHCDRGVSRSSTIVIAYLMRKYKWSLGEALEIVKDKRKIRPSSTFMKQLQIWNEVEYNIWDLKGIPKAPYQAYLDERAMILKSKGLTGDEPIAPVNL
jgi:hypothetical protein